VSGAEPEYTIYVPAWGVARERVGTVEPEETRGPPMSGPDAGTCRAAIAILLHGLPAEQREHATVFLLNELERLYASAGHPAPVWVAVLRRPTPSPLPPT
jgi:hypothetical protein